MKIGEEDITELLHKGTDLSTVPFNGADLSFIDFRNANNLTAENWLSAELIRGCKLPAGMDFSRVSLKGRDVEWVDFSMVEGLTAKNWLSAKKLSYSTLPAGMDFSGVSLRDAFVTGVDFSLVSGLTPENLQSAKDYQGCKYPNTEALERYRLQKQAIEVTKISKEIAKSLQGRKSDIATASIRGAWAVYKGILNKDEVMGFANPADLVDLIEQTQAQKIPRSIGR